MAATRADTTRLVPDDYLGTYTGQNQGPWNVTGNGQYVVEGGEFPSVNGVGQQGLVRFAVSTIAPDKQGPVVTGANFVPTRLTDCRNCRVAFQANWDEDNTALTYKVVRDGNTSTPIYTAHRQFHLLQPALHRLYRYGAQTPGSTHTYRVYVYDPLGNSQSGSTVDVTIGSGDQQRLGVKDSTQLCWRERLLAARRSVGLPRDTTGPATRRPHRAERGDRRRGPVRSTVTT